MSSVVSDCDVMYDKQVNKSRFASDTIFPLTLYLIICNIL